MGVEWYTFVVSH